MKRTPEHSARSRTPSIGTPDGPLARACRAAATLRNGAVEALLRHALDGTGTDRAFLLATGSSSDGRTTSVAVAVTRTENAVARPSGSVLRRAAASSRPWILPDVRQDGALADAASVRSLDVGRVIALPVPARMREPSPLLLLDGAGPCEESPLSLRRRAEGFASLLAVVLDRDGGLPLADLDERDVAPDLPPLIGRAPAFLAALEQAARGSRTPFPILLEGESGTGKDGIARRVHAGSARRSGPFVAINCAAFPEGLLESELFGVLRGAYTGADRDRVGLFRRAHGGTLFLDEVGDTSSALQAKLLRALQERRVRPVGSEDEIEADVRVVAATHRDLRGMAARGSFRADLYHRLAFVTIRVPPLRERLSDLPDLVAHLLGQLRRQAGLPEGRASAGFLDRLARHDWPGNVRELEAVIARARLRSDRPVLEASDLDLPEPASTLSTPGAASPGSLERVMIETALRESGEGLGEAARRIGWTRQKLHRRMAALGIPRLRGSAGLFPP